MYCLWRRNADLALVDVSSLGFIHRCGAVMELRRRADVNGTDAGGYQELGGFKDGAAASSSKAGIHFTLMKTTIIHNGRQEEGNKRVATET